MYTCEYILDLIYKFNLRTGNNYDPTRGYNIMQCYLENKIEYYPRDFNKYDWLIGAICRNYTSNDHMNIITLPKVPIYNSSIYSFLILDYYNVKTYDELFNVIMYNLSLNSMQIKQLTKRDDLRKLIKELCNNKYKFVGANNLFEILESNGKKSIHELRKRKPEDELDMEFKSMKLD